MSLFKKNSAENRILWDSYYQLLKKSDWEKALSVLRDIENKNPDDPQIQLKIGDMNQRRGNKEGAIKAYEKASYILVREGFIQKAVAVLNIVLRMDPGNASARRKLQLILEHSVKAEKGIPAFELLRKPDAPSPEIRFSPEPSGGQETSLMESGPPSFGEISLPEASASSETPEPHLPEYREVWVKPSDIPFRSVEKEFEETGKDMFVEKEFEDFHEVLDSAIEDFADKGIEPGKEEECPVCFLPLGRTGADSFIDKAPLKKYMSGQHIFKEGEYGTTVYLVKSGSIKILTHFGSLAIVLTTLKKGDLFGELSFLTGRMRTTAAVADADSVLAEFDQILMAEAITINPEVIECLNDLYLTHFTDAIKMFSGE